MGFHYKLLIFCFINLFLLRGSKAFRPECIQHSKHRSLNRTFFESELILVADTILLLHAKTLAFLMSVLEFYLFLYYYFLVKFRLNLTLSSEVPGFCLDLIRLSFKNLKPVYSYHLHSRYFLVVIFHYFY